MCQIAQAQASIELIGPAQTTYTAPATYQLQLRSSVTGSGPKAEYLSGVQLTRNGAVVSRLSEGTHTENGISAGTYQYEFTAWAIRNVNGDEFSRELKSSVITITVEAPPTPFDGAEYVSAEWPNSGDRGTPFSGTVTVRNTGNTTWTAGEGYRLGQAERYVSSAVKLGIAEVPVPHDVAPGGTVTFPFNGAAATDNGPTTVQWQMNRNGVRFGSTSSEQTFETTGRLNRGVMYEQEVPTTMEAGKSYTVKLKFTNTGNTTWTAAGGYALGSWNPENNARWGLSRVPMPNDVLPQLPAFFEFNVVAPTLPGTYSFQWRLLEEKVEWFGRESDDVQVTVVGPPSQVVGNIDEVSAGGLIRGWACSTGIDTSIDIHIYTGAAAENGGTMLLGAKADQSSEEGVAASCKAGGSHRFSIQLDNEQRRQRGGQPIYVHGISPVGGPNSAIAGSGSFVVPAAPSGSLTVVPGFCQIAEGGQNCPVTLSWQANDPGAQVRDSAGTVIGSGLEGSKEVSVAAGTHVFTLLVGSEQLARVSASARGPPLPPGKPDNPAPTVTRRYVYDDNLRLCKVIEPETGSTVFGYDAAGNVAWSAQGVDLSDPANCNRDAAQIAPRRITRSYDVLNRLKELAHPDGLGDQQITYTPAGQVQTETVFNQDRLPVVTTRTYNSLGSVSSQARTVGTGGARTLTFGFDSLGQHVSTAYPEGYVVKQTLNALGQPVRLEDGSGSLLASNIIHSPSGAITALTYGNGVVRSVQENARQLIGQIQEGPVLDIGNSYDVAGNIIQIRDGVRGDAGQVALGYDRLDRLVQASAPAYGGSGQYSFAYDTLDNIIAMRLPGKRERSFHYDTQNRLELLRDPDGSGVSGFAYDAAGNMSTRNGQAFVFDIGGRLRAAGAVQKYLYDAAGYRAAAEGEVSSDWHHLGGGELMESTRGEERSEYIYLGKRLLALRTSSAAGAKLTYLHYDALNTLAATTDSAGAVKSRYFWSPYGEPDSAPDGSIPGYSGHLADADTGLTYMGQRYYDPQLARFISPDPLAASTSGAPNFNRYRYASNNPFRFSDPTGACDQVTGSNICNGRGFAGARLQTIQVTSGGIPIHSPGTVTPAAREAATGWEAAAEYFAERNFFTGQGSLTDVDAVTEAIIAPLMNTPAAGPAAGGTKLAAALLVVRAGAATRGFGNLTRAGEFGIAPYNVLKKAVGTGSGLQVHHLLEKRFAGALGVKEREMLSVVVTKQEHQVFTNAWRKAIPYGTDYSTVPQQQIMSYARDIYANNPAILKALGL
jgi:RHS repeat-associated protein